MIKYTAWGICRDVTKHMRGVSTVKTNTKTGLMISPVVAKKNLNEATLKRAVVHNGFYYFDKNENMKPLADSKIIREAVLSRGMTPGLSMEDLERFVIREVSRSDPEFLIEIGKKPDAEAAREFIERKHYESRVKSGCPKTVIAICGEHDTLICGVTKIHTADGKYHLVKSDSVEKALADTDIGYSGVSLDNLQKAFKGTEPSMRSRVRTYIIDTAFKLIKEIDEVDNLIGGEERASLAKAGFLFNKTVLSCKDVYIGALEKEGLTWGESVISFCDEVAGVGKLIPAELKEFSILS